MGLFGDILGGIGGAVGGLVSGGPIGAVTGALKGSGLVGGGGQQAARRGRGLQQPPRRGSAGRPGRIGGELRINPPFGGPPGVGVGGGVGFSPPSSGRNGGRISRKGGQQLPMIGAVGVEPEVDNVPTRRCPTGMVLAIDGRCYPKKMVTRRFRMWPTPRKGPISRSEMKALQAAKRVEKKVKRLGRKITDNKTLRLED